MPGKNLIKKFLDNKKPSYQDSQKLNPEQRKFVNKFFDKNKEEKDSSNLIEKFTNKKATVAEDPNVINFEKLKKGISAVESLDGKLMINPQSTATGLYGQRFSELENLNLTKGLSREDFSKDIDYQNKIFEMRYNDQLKDIPGLKKSAYDLTEEYESQLNVPDKNVWNYSLDEVAALVNFLGREGTRQYFGYVLRDGRTLEDVFPTKYGEEAEQDNKTPEEYLRLYREGRDK
jgi:hypothetical protein